MPTLGKDKQGRWRVQFFSNYTRASKLLGKMSEEEARKIVAEMDPEPLLAKKRKIRPVENITDSIISRVYSRAKASAKARGIPFLVSRDDIYRLLRRSRGKCEVSKIPFDNDYIEPGCSTRPWAVSLDRKNSQLPYTVENCRLVCVAVNIALGQWGGETLKRVAESIVMQYRYQNGPRRIPTSAKPPPAPAR